MTIGPVGPAKQAAPVERPGPVVPADTGQGGCHGGGGGGGGAGERGGGKTIFLLLMLHYLIVLACSVGQKIAISK